MPGDSQEKNWRDNWVVKKILAEAPIIGSFFSKKDWREAFIEAGKCTTSIFVGGAAMMLTMPKTSEMHSDEARVALAATSMAAGMMVGKVIYNITTEGCGMLYQYYVSKNTRHSSSVLGPSTIVETEALNGGARVITPT